MTRSKKIFVALMLFFFLGLILLVYDISRKTTFPSRGAKPSRIKDTSKSYLPPKSATHQP